MSDNRLRSYARAMHRQPTEAEERLWGALRDRRLMKLKFRWQVPLGPFIVDFVCTEARLIVEVDGVQHAESTRDAVRDRELEQRGFRVLRFWNGDVMHDLDTVCDAIIGAAREQGMAFS